MNFESGTWRREALESDVLDANEIDQRRKRRLIIAAVVLAIAVAAIAYALFSSGGEETAPAGGQGQTLPAVTFVVPGRQQVDRVITVTGNLAARRDMPVGINGEGGEVSRVLVEPGDWVREGQVLAVVERSVQSQQAAQLAASIQVAQADARLAQQELERAQSLVGRGFISKADVERRIATRDAANARVKVAQAQLGETRARIARLDIRAPASGLVLDRMVEPGQVVGAGSGTLFRIAMNGEMEMLGRMTQSDLSRVGVGVPVTVRPVGSAQTFQGKVWQVSPVIDPQTRQGEARILLGYDRALRPGGFASAEIRAGQADAPLLPESAVLSDNQGSYVYVIDGSNKVARRPVKVGSVTDNGVIISEGLSGNERVVLSAGAFLNPGDPVRPERARAAR